jgi:protein CrcB
MVSYILVMLGGALGTGARFCVSGFIAERAGEVFPLGTLVVNVSGSFVIGFFAAFTDPEGAVLVSPRLRQFFMIGACGGYTTFSSFSVQTLVRLLSRRGLARTHSCRHAFVEIKERMQIPEDAVLLRIFIGESDRYRHQPLYETIVLKAREMQMAGATVLRGPMGFGKSSHLHTAKILRLSMDLPIVIEIVDSEDKVNAFLPVLDEVMGGGLVTLEKAKVIRYQDQRKSE